MECDVWVVLIVHLS